LKYEDLKIGDVIFYDARNTPYDAIFICFIDSLDYVKDAKKTLYISKYLTIYNEPFEIFQRDWYVTISEYNETPIHLLSSYSPISDILTKKYVVSSIFKSGRK